LTVLSASRRSALEAVNFMAVGALQKGTVENQCAPRPNKGTHELIHNLYGGGRRKIQGRGTAWLKVRPSIWSFASLSLEIELSASRTNVLKHFQALSMIQVGDGKR